MKSPASGPASAASKSQISEIRSGFQMEAGPFLFPARNTIISNSLNCATYRILLSLKRLVRRVIVVENLCMSADHDASPRLKTANTVLAVVVLARLRTGCVAGDACERHHG